MTIKYNLSLSLFDAIVTQLRIRFPEARYKQLQIMACVYLYPNYLEQIVKLGFSKNKQSALQQVQNLFDEEFLETKINEDGSKSRKLLREDISSSLQKENLSINLNINII